jgi:hypothetical protein
MPRPVMKQPLPRPAGEHAAYGTIETVRERESSVLLTTFLAVYRTWQGEARSSHSLPDVAQLAYASDAHRGTSEVAGGGSATAAAAAAFFLSNRSSGCSTSESRCLLAVYRTWQGEARSSHSLPDVAQLAYASDAHGCERESQ